VVPAGVVVAASAAEAGAAFVAATGDGAAGVTGFALMSSAAWPGRCEPIRIRCGAAALDSVAFSSVVGCSTWGDSDDMTAASKIHFWQK
jgi:hypothetical protein